MNRQKAKINRTKQRSNAREKKFTRPGFGQPQNDSAESDEPAINFVRREVGSNWTRYQESEDVEKDDPQLNSADLELLLELPTIGSERYKMSYEKNWEDEQNLIEAVGAGKYFNINLALLTKGLSTIPFYRRMDYPSSMFTTKEIARMDKKAGKAEENYAPVLSKFEAYLQDEGSKPGSRNTSAKSKPKDNPKSASVAEKANVKEAIDDTADGVAKMEVSGEKVDTEEPPKPEEKPITEGEQKKEDLQEWLDGILDQ